MSYDFDKVLPRTGTHSLKWEFMGNMSPYADEDTIPMWVADMDFRSPPPMIEAMHKRVDEGIFGYCNVNTKEYWSSIANRYRRRFDWYINCEKMVYVEAIVPAFKNIINLYTQPGDGIIVQDPIYYPFARTTNVTKRTVVNNTLIENNGYYTMDYEDLERKAADPRNKIAVLCSPHNPTGRVWREDELRRFYEICEKHDLLIVSDEVHQDLLRPGQKHIPLAKLYPQSKRILTCLSPTKTFNLGGLKIASVIIPDDDMRRYWLANATSLSVTPISLAASVAVYNEGQDWADEVTKYISDNFEFTAEFFRKHLPKVKFNIAEGSYLAWPDISAYGYPSDEFEQLLVKESGLLLEAGDVFGETGKGHMRMNLACPRPLLEEALWRMERILNRVQPGQELRAGDKLGDVGGKPLQLWFLRNDGCITTQAGLKKLAEIYPTLKAKGISLIAVVDHASDDVMGQMPFPVLPDKDGALREVYRVCPALSEKRLYSHDAAAELISLREAGFREREMDGEKKLLPAAFAFDGNGICTYAHYACDIADLPDPAELCDC